MRFHIIYSFYFSIFRNIGFWDHIPYSFGLESKPKISCFERHLLQREPQGLPSLDQFIVTLLRTRDLTPSEVKDTLYRVKCGVIIQRLRLNTCTYITSYEAKIYIVDH